MPDLGDYAATVLSAYGITIVLIAGIVLATVLDARRTRDRLRKAESGK